MPMILGIALLFCSLFYFAESLKDGGFSARICETREWFHAVVSDKTTHTMAVGVIIMAVYTFLLMSFLPFLAFLFDFYAHPDGLFKGRSTS